MSEQQARVQTHCSVCNGTDGHHYPNCSVLAENPHDERNPAEGNNEIPPQTMEEFADDGGMANIEKPNTRDLSQEEIAEHFETADKLFDGKKFEDGAVVSEEEFDEHKLPPTLTDFASSDLLWLVAKVCHEVNRAFCAEIMADHSHVPWEDTPPELRASIYEGVVMHFENPELQPEESHRAWMEYKIKEGWTYGNVKNVLAKVHPCLLPYHQLHAHDRAKDNLFAAVCKAMFGE